MTTQVRMPQLGWTMEEGTVMRWYAQEGDVVREGEPLLEVMTDKVSMDVEAPASGILHAVSVRENETVAVDAVIALIGEPGVATVAQPPDVSSTKRVEAGAQREVKATPIAQRMATHHGVDLAQVDADNRGGVIRKKDVESYLQRNESHAAEIPHDLASPAARQLARQHSLNLAAVQGSGPDGAVLLADVERQLQQHETPDHSQVSETRIPLSQLRKLIGRRMQQSVQTAPHFTMTVEADVTEIEQRRQNLVKHVEQRAGSKLTPTVLLVKAVAVALRGHPYLRATLDGEQIVIADPIHIGVAVALEDGLIVPVLHHVERMGLAAIAGKLDELATRARESKLTPEDVEGGTFTISNLGMYGIDHFTAIINPPQSAILAVGRIARKPVFAGDQVVGRLMMKLTLSADHRVIDGALAAAFLADLRAHLEQPDLLLL